MRTVSSCVATLLGILLVGFVALSCNAPEEPATSAESRANQPAQMTLPAPPTQHAPATPPARAEADGEDIVAEGGSEDDEAEDGEENENGEELEETETSAGEKKPWTDDEGRPLPPEQRPWTVATEASGEVVGVEEGRIEVREENGAVKAIESEGLRKQDLERLLGKRVRVQVGKFGGTAISPLD